MQIKRFTTTIPSGKSLSAAVEMAPYTLCGVVMSPGWDAASMTFQSVGNNAQPNNVYNNAGEYTLAVAAGNHVTIPRADLESVGTVIVRSGTNGSPVNQTADRLITLLGCLPPS